MRAALIEKLKRGDRAEPGRFCAELEGKEFRYLSAKALRPILGPSEVARLQGLVVPAVYQYLVIEENR
jgi:hypothetical protein